MYEIMPNVAYERCIKKDYYLDKKQVGRFSFGSIFFVRMKNLAQSNYETLFRFFYRYSLIGVKTVNKHQTKATNVDEPKK